MLVLVVVVVLVVLVVVLVLVVLVVVVLVVVVVVAVVAVVLLSQCTYTSDPKALFSFLKKFASQHVSCHNDMNVFNISACKHVPTLTRLHLSLGRPLRVTIACNFLPLNFRRK